MGTELAFGSPVTWPLTAEVSLVAAPPLAFQLCIVPRLASFLELAPVGRVPPKLAMHGTPEGTRTALVQSLCCLLARPDPCSCRVGQKARRSWEKTPGTSNSRPHSELVLLRYCTKPCDASLSAGRGRFRTMDCNGACIARRASALTQLMSDQVQRTLRTRYSRITYRTLERAATSIWLS